MPKEIILDKEELEKLYTKLKSIIKIAEIYNVSYNTIRRKLHKYGIEIFSQKIDLNVTKEELELLYKLHKSVELLAKIYNVSKDTIYKNLHKHEIKIFPRGINLNITKEELEKLYIELKSTTVLAKKFNVSTTTIVKRLKKFNIKLYPTGGVRKYDFNHSFFKEINEETLYWAGFIAADGCVYEKSDLNKILYINLSSKDHEHLEKFAKVINYTGKVRKNNNLNRGKMREYSILTLNSKEIFEDLAKFNIVPRKSFILKFPNWLIEHPLVHHFIRGYNDGDGCFSAHKYKTKKNQIINKIVGTENFLENINLIFKNNLKNVSNTVKFNNKIKSHISFFELTYSGNKILKSIAEFLYQDATIYLERKYDIIKHLLNE
jgi:transposase